MICFGSAFNPSHEDVKSLPFQLHEIVCILNAAQYNLENVVDGDLVIVLGNTGCGKSTMLNSILLGPDSLELKEVKVEVEANGRKKKKKVK